MTCTAAATFKAFSADAFDDGVIVLVLGDTVADHLDGDVGFVAALPPFHFLFLGLQEEPRLGEPCLEGGAMFIPGYKHSVTPLTALGRLQTNGGDTGGGKWREWRDQNYDPTSSKK